MCLLGYSIPAKAQTSSYGQKYNCHRMSEELQQKMVKEVQTRSRGITQHQERKLKEMFVVPRHAHRLETFDQLRSVVFITARLQKQPDKRVYSE